MSSSEKLISRGEAYDAEPQPRQRLQYGAVPLDPWKASFHHRQQTYWNASIQRIQRKLRSTMVDQDWFRVEDQAHELHELMNTSLIHSHYTRLDKNALADTRLVEEMGDPRLDNARMGLATPEELFTLLVDYPELRSLELAKLSHPFDFDATHDMDEALEDLILGADGEILDGDPRYKVKRVDANTPAAIILRKRDMMDFPMEGGAKVRIVHRQGFLVFNGNGMSDGQNFERFLKQPRFIPLRNHALGAMVEHYLDTYPQGQPYGWVQPQATSYYAKYIPRPPVAI